DDGVEGLAARAQVTLDDKTLELDVAGGQTLLEAIRKQKLDPPFSCQSGVCGACRARLTTGEVHMRSRMALEDRDIERGTILTCQSVARSRELAIVFED
ncbi:MAG: 2Fe-2S iron-sulfur cluster binding domain-containing protein, partial [Pseudomonadota bacterium]